MREVSQVTDPCRIKPEELVAWQDGTLPTGRREIVEAHLTACPHCQERLASFREIDAFIQRHATPVEDFVQGRAALHDRLRREGSRKQDSSRSLRLAAPLRRPVVVRLLVGLFVVLAVVPVATQAGFPLGSFVRFAEVEIKEWLPLDEQRPIRHVAPTDPTVSRTSFSPVAPAQLPLGLMRVEQSTPNADQVELLYRNDAGVAILVTELPAETGMVTLEETGTDLASVRGIDVLIVRDPRPDAVAALIWERGDVYFDVRVIEAPTGGNGGLKQADAFVIVEGLIEAQDANQE
jgi:anti-sigma factor RsiW